MASGDAVTGADAAAGPVSGVREAEESFAEPDGTAGRERMYRGQSAAERREDRRNRLLEAALEQFASEGYTGTTITGICRGAGVTTQHFYDEFGSREAMLRTLSEETAQVASEAVVAALDDEPPGDRARRTRVGLSAYLHAMLDDPRRARVQCIESVGVSPSFEEHRREVRGSFRSVLAREGALMAEADGAVQGDARYVTAALVGAAEAAMIAWLNDPDPPPIDHLVDEVAHLFTVVGEGFVQP